MPDQQSYSYTPPSGFNLTQSVVPFSFMDNVKWDLKNISVPDVYSPQYQKQLRQALGEESYQNQVNDLISQSKKLAWSSGQTGTAPTNESVKLLQDNYKMLVAMGVPQEQAQASTFGALQSSQQEYQTTQQKLNQDPTKIILPIALSFVAPGIGSVIAAELGVSAVVGTAIANTALQIAAGIDPEKALQNAITSAVVQTGSAAVATEINTGINQVVESPKLAASISNAAGSALASGITTAAKGGSTNDIIQSALAGAAGSATTSFTGESALGGAVAGGLVGGTTGALSGAAGALGREAFEETSLTAQAPSGIQIAQADTGTVSDVGVSPTQEAIGRMAGGGEVTADDMGEIVIKGQRIYDPSLTVAPFQFGDITKPYVAPGQPTFSIPFKTEETPTDATEEEGTLAKETTTKTDYKPSLTTVSSTPSIGGAPRTSKSALSDVLRTEMAAPLSTTGLTAYRPAGEIESEESGKGRQDVWNEASLRLKDALGL